MTEQLTEQQHLPPQKKRWRIIRWLLISFMVLIVTLIIGILALASSDQGSRWLLDFVMKRQHMISYQYQSGNLLRGIILQNILVNVKDVEVKVAKADVQLGWRAVVNKEIHLMKANVGEVQVINHAPSKDEEFKFNPINLPFVLRLDNAKIDKLVIKNQKSSVNFYDLQLYDTVWSGTKVQLVNSSMAMDFLSVKNVNGYMQFDGKYPLNVKADLTIPALKALNLNQIKIDARGDLDTVQAGIASATPDIISGYALVHPVRKDVPMQAKMTWDKFNWPLLTEQALFSEKGDVSLHGDIQKLYIDLNTDLSGKNIPQGQYKAALNTDLKQLNIDDFQAYLMKGNIALAGVVGWQDKISWDIKGKMQGLNPKDQVIPAIITEFLPPNLNGSLVSKGNLQAETDISAQIAFDQYEHWDVTLHQAAKNQNQQPWLINAAWQNFNRTVPYIGWLKSDKGEVDLALTEKGQDIRVATTISAHDESALPWGNYDAVLDFSQNILNVKKFALTQANSQVDGVATLHLPTDQTQLKWNAQLNAKAFNPQNIIETAPLNRVDGQIVANGYAQTNKQIIQLNKIDLKGQLVQGDMTQPVALTGKSTIAVLLHDGKQQTGLRGFAVNYDGGLNAQYSQGPLKLRISGTPTELNIAELFHDGAAGQINAKGHVNLNKGIAWNLQAAFKQFKPHYFVSSLQGNITGQLNSNGRWDEQQKFIALRDLNLHGQLNNKPIIGKGNLTTSFTTAHGLMPSQFEANDLVLSYANNIVYATGNAQRLQLNINAPRLHEIYAGLRGTVKGFLSVQMQPKLNVKSNLIIDKLGFKNLVEVEKMSLVGILPTSVTQSSTLVFNLQNARSGNRSIDDITANLQGKLGAHLLNFSAYNRLSKFNLQLAGGFNSQYDWMGQLQKGVFKSDVITLEQDKNVNIVFKKVANLISLSDHCWKSKDNARSEICFDQTTVLSQPKGFVSVKLKNIELGDFRAFLPAGLSLAGKLNGYTHLSWLDQQPMKLDAQITTQNGNVGLLSEDQSQPVTLDYREVKISAKTQTDGLALKINANTPLLGSGFANVLIGTGADKALSGLMVVDGMKLSLLKPFIADVRALDGMLSAAGKLTGTLQKPLFNGEVRLKEGVFALTSVPVNLQKIEVSAAIGGDQVTLKGRFNAGQGVGRLTGQMNWGDNPKIDLKLNGADLQVAQPPLVIASVSPDLQVQILPKLKTLNVNGFIGIPSAVISMPEASPSIVNVSSDVRVVDSRQQLAYINDAKPWSINATIGVQLNKNQKADNSREKDEKVIFRGFNSVIPLAGILNLNQRGTEIALRANGAIGVSRQVIIEAYGQRLNLNRAIARFGGELANPTLDIDATKNVQNSTIGIRVTGGATRPNVEIYNDAGLTEQEATNALLTGRISSGSSGLNNTEGFKSDVNNTIAAAGISMGLGGTRALTNQIGRTFGLSGLALDAQGSGDDTQVSVTGYITPDLYLRYGVGIFTPVNKLTLRYQMNRRLYVEATSSLERAVDIFYHWKF